MDLGEPMSSAIPTVAGPVLAVLARAEEPLTGREIARLAKRHPSHTGVQHALAGLVQAGIVDRVDRGRAALFSLNREHVAAAPILELARLRDRLYAAITEAVADWEIAADSVTVFGSAARGDGDAESDVDLLIVRPARIDRTAQTWSAQLSSLADRVARWSGNPLRVVELTAAELAHQRASGDAYLFEVLRDGITLAGAPLRRLHVLSDR